MQKSEILKNLLNMKIILSLVGGIFVSVGNPFIGNGIWAFSALLWVYHFHKTEDVVAEIMFWIHWIIAMIGIYYWGIIL